MKGNTKIIILYLRMALGEKGLQIFLDLYHGMRPTLPEWESLECLDRPAEVLEAWLTKAPGTITEFCQQEARKRKRGPRTIKRALDSARALKKSA